MKKIVYMKFALFFLCMCFIEATAYAQSEGEHNGYFKSVLISKDFVFEDSYILNAADFNNDKYPDIITYGLGAYDKETNQPLKTNIFLFTNPKITADANDQTWQSKIIYTLETPVAVESLDIDKDGWADLLMSTDYGKNIEEPLDGGGTVFWLKNPGNNNQEWERHNIGNDTGMHRIVKGYFTQNKNIEIITLPVVGRPHNVHSAIPVAIYQQPDDVSDVTPWPKAVIMESYFHLIHDAWVGKNPELSNLDVMLVASQEGISWLYFDEKHKKWKVKLVSKGETSLSDFIDPKTNKLKTHFWFTGANTAASGKIENNPNRFIASLEPFHGSSLVTYVTAGKKWNRNVIGKYGHVDDQGFGTGHYVITHDFDKDGTDEFLAAFPKDPKGILYGKVKDFKSNTFDVTRVFDKSSARISIADFDQDGKDDFATVGYKVRYYYEEDNPQMYVHLNTIK